MKIDKAQYPLDLGLPESRGNNSEEGEPLLNEREVAARLKCSVKWLQKKRLQGGGIPFLKLSRRMVRYEVADVEKFKARTRRVSTSDIGPQTLIATDVGS